MASAPTVAPMRTVGDFNFDGHRALVRVDFNVKQDDNGKVVDATRIKAAMPTVQKILNDGGSAVLMSHLGRPDKDNKAKFTLKNVADYVADNYGITVHFANDCVNEEAAQKAADLKPGEMLLLENTRFYSEEKKGDTEFAKKLSVLGDVYVNDAFGTAHRAHASTAVVADFFPKDKRMFGYLMAKEIDSANKVLGNAERPFTAILGGAKVSDKITIIENLLEKADNIIIGGGMAYTFFKAMNGQIGNSLCEEDKLELALSLMEKAKAKGVNIILPTDSIVADKFDANANANNADNNSIPDGWMGLDIGPKAMQEFKDVIANSRTILWNGPMGVFEFEKFQKGTEEIARSVADATETGAFSLIGGGDSVAAINKFNLADKVSYVSTGGGAMLEFFEGKELPGIKAINQ